MGRKGAKHRQAHHSFTVGLACFASCDPPYGIVGMPFFVSAHPLIQHKLARLRNEGCPSRGLEQRRVIIVEPLPCVGLDFRRPGETLPRRRNPSMLNQLRRRYFILKPAMKGKRKDAEGKNMRLMKSKRR